MTAATDKDTLRCEMRSRLAAMDAAEVGKRSAAIVEALCKDERWLGDARTVALFGGIKGEPELLGLMPWLIDRQVTPVFFGFQDGQLLPQAMNDRTRLDRGVFGVWIPPFDAPVVSHASLDVILTPGLAFDVQGRRLGRGRGYFDRMFARPDVQARRIGVCWEFQRVQAVPVEPHDAPMDQVITEERTSFHPRF